MQNSVDRNVALALLAGIVLAVMIDWNSELARSTTPLVASWTAHGVGAVASLALVILLPRQTGGTQTMRSPIWSYIGGIPGAFTVLLAAVTVNSALGLSGTLALMLIGQMAFGISADLFGFFGLRRRRPESREVWAITLVLAGSIAIIAGRS